MKPVFIRRRYPHSSPILLIPDPSIVRLHAWIVDAFGCPSFRFETLQFMTLAVRSRGFMRPEDMTELFFTRCTVSGMPLANHVTFYRSRDARSERTVLKFLGLGEAYDVAVVLRADVLCAAIRFSDRNPSELSIRRILGMLAPSLTHEVLEEGTQDSIYDW